MRYSLPPLDPELYETVPEPEYVPEKMPESLGYPETGDADRGIGLTPAPVGNLAPDFVRQIPASAIREEQRKNQADEFMSSARQALADKWREIAQQDLKARATEHITNFTGRVEQEIGAWPERMLSEYVPQEVRSGQRTLNPLEAVQIAGITPTPFTGLPTAAAFGLSRLASRGEEDPFGETMINLAMPGPVIGKAAGKWNAAMQTDDILRHFNRPPTPGLGIGERVSGALSDIERLFADRYSAINKVSPEVEAKLSAYAGHVGGGFQHAADELGPVYGVIGDDLPVLNKYTGLQTYIENAQQKANPARRGAGLASYSIGDAQNEIAAMQRQLDPDVWQRVLDADQMRIAARNRTLEEEVRSGIMPRNLADWLMENMPHHSSTVHVKYLEAAQQGEGGKTLRQMSNTIKRLTKEGFEGEQLPPMQAELKDLLVRDLAVRRNDILTQMVEDGKFPATPATQRVTGTVVNAILGTADPGALATVETKSTRDLRGKVGFMKDGVPWVAEVPDDIARVIGNMNTDELNAAEKVGYGLNLSLRLGATQLNPTFLATNMMRDYVSAFVREGVMPQEWVEGLRQAISHGPEYRKLMRGGGGYGIEGGMYHGPEMRRSQNIEDIEKSIQKLGASPLATQADFGRLTRALERHDLGELAKFIVTMGPVQEVGQAIEMAPRIATYGKALRGGASEAEAVMRARRVTVDFSRQGELIRHLNPWIPFLNARLQGGMNMIRTMRDNPSARKRAALLATAAGGAYLWNRQFPEYKDVPQYVKDQYQVIMVPGQAEEDPSGLGYAKNGFITLPLGDWAPYASAAEEALKALDKDSDFRPLDAIGRIANATSPLPGEGAAGAVTGLLAPTAPGKMLFEELANYDYFRGRAIESESMEGMLPELRYTPRTTEVARRLSESLPDPIRLSPVRIEHIINTTTGGLGRSAMRDTSRMLGQELEGPSGPGTLISGLYRTYGGEIESRAYSDRDRRLGELASEYRPYIRAIEESTGTGTLGKVPNTILGKLSLQPREQAIYQEARLAFVKELFETANLDTEAAAMTKQERKVFFSKVAEMAGKMGSAAVLEVLGDEVINQRLTQAIEGTNQKRALPTEEYTPAVRR